MNVAVMLLHVDCPSRTEASPSPVKMQLIGREGQLFGHCTACDEWVTVTIDPTLNPKRAVPAVSEEVVPT